MVRSGASFALILLLAACARTEDASLVQPEDEGGYNRVEQVRTPERDDQEIAIGEWRDSLQDEQRVLEFGPTGAPPQFSLRCDQRRGILLQRHGVAPTGGLPMMLVSIGSETRRLAVTTVPGTVPLLRAAIPPSDDLTETLASAGEPITVRIGDSPPLVLPQSPAIGTFVRSCAAPAAPPAAEPEAGEDANAAEPANAAATD